VPARIAAFAAIVIAGACGALIGGSLVSLQCKGNCTTPTGAGAIVGGVIAAVGVAVIAVLTLRAMGEWRRISEEELLGADGDEGDDGDEGGDERGKRGRGGEGGGQDGYSSRNPSA